MDFFKHFETCTQQERGDIAAELVRMYNTAVDNENDLFHSGSRFEYGEALGKLAMLQGVFCALGIEFEPGQKLEVKA